MLQKPRIVFVAHSWESNCRTCWATPSNGPTRSDPPLLQHLFNPKQTIIRYIDLLQFLAVECSLDEGAIPLLYLVRRNWTTAHILDDEHFLRPSGQIHLLERARFLAESHPIPHLELGTLSLSQSIAVQVIPLLPLVGPHHSIGSQPGALMGSDMVPPQQGQLIHVLKRVAGVKHAIQAVPSLHHRRLAVLVRRKMRNPFTFQQRLKKYIVKFFTLICLQSEGLTPPLAPSRMRRKAPSRMRQQRLKRNIVKFFTLIRLQSQGLTPPLAPSRMRRKAAITFFQSCSLRAPPTRT